MPHPEPPTGSRPRPPELHVPRHSQPLHPLHLLSTPPLHVVVTTHRRRRFFASPHVARAAFRILTSHERTVAAVLMPDRLHWILDRAQDASRAVDAFQSLSTRLAREVGHEGRLWRRSFRGTELRGRRLLAQTIRCVLAQPVRAGLVERPDEHPWSYCRFEVAPR